ncbi:hypothetical protein [Gaetbulibacter saemankumensis]|uniref:hypothetical protein n=1 Tax=Gaetbulibacter saemankumensis TaxID=311208 RepID=UPI0004273E66|nr:hypothetical protein [Gaetbulibacter saemankumensis]
MKKIINTLIFAVFTIMFGNASEIDYTISNNNLKKTAITLTNVKAGNILTIKDSNNFVIFKESIKENGTYKKGFDLTALPSGNYVFEIEKDLEIKTIPFKINYKQVTFLNNEEATTYKPFLRQDKDMIFITKYCPNKEPLKISIFVFEDTTYRLIHSEKITGSQTLEKAYRLSKKGDYKIVINSNNKEHTKFINN